MTDRVVLTGLVFQADPKDFAAQAKIVAQMVREFGPFFIKMAQVAGNSQASGITDLALLVPELIQIAERTLDMNKLKDQTVGEVLNTLNKRASAEDRPSPVNFAGRPMRIAGISPLAAAK